MREKSFGIWQSWNWAQARDEIGALAFGLSRLGIRRGDRVALIGDNRPRLYWSITALQALGAVPVPLFPDISPPELAARLMRVKARSAVAEGQEEVDKLLEAGRDNPRLTSILFDRARGMRRYAQPFLHALDAVAEHGAATARRRAWFEAEIAAGRTDDPAIILFTSGATGEAKPAMLSHDLLIRNGRAMLARDGLGEREEVFAYLPMAWYADHLLGYSHALVAGYCVSCPESGETVFNDLREIGPTYFAAPSWLFEKIYRDAMARIDDAGWLQRRLFFAFTRQAPRSGAMPLESGRGIPGARARGLLGEILIRGPLRDALGLSRMRVVYAIGEALSQPTARFYRAIGIDIRRCYGAVEAGGFIAAQARGAASADDVGSALPGMRIKLAEDGELLFRGPAAFLGYDGDESAIESRAGGGDWFASGDAGRIDSSGRVEILGRSGEVGRLEGGARFAPGRIEARLKAFPEIGEAVVLGRGRAYCAAMICVDRAVARALAEARGPRRKGDGDFTVRGEIYDLLQARIEELNGDFTRDSALAPLRIRRFLVLPREFSADAGEITRSWQLRRRRIEEKFADLIDALYADAPGFAVWRGAAADEEGRGEGPERLEIRALPEVR